MSEQNPLTAIWTSSQKWFFRYIFLFFGFIIFPFPLNIIPGVSGLLDFYTKFWDTLAAYFGKNLLGVTSILETKFTGSGDTLFDWVHYFTYLLLALAIGTIWSFIDRERPNYELLKRWFVLFLTFYLAYFMFVYGIIKMFYLQFRPPNLERLYQTFGQASPMRLLWTFMGFSEAYTKFAGFSETLAGALLVFRRTRTLGALIAVGVMFNVFMMNMSYDVPVKLFSFQLMIMGLYIAMIDYRRLLNVFFLNRVAEPAPDDHVFQDKRRNVVLVLQILLVGYMVISQINGSLNAQKQYGTKRPKPALYGVYEVEQFTKNRDTLLPLTTDLVRWKRLLIDYVHFVSVIKMDDKVKRFNSEIDTVKQQFTWTVGQDTVNRYIMSYQLTGDSLLRIDGVLEGDTLGIDLKRYPLENFGLLNRGFNWVNEVPYNRYNYE